MSEVANQISSQLNYKVLMDETLRTVPITGRFHGITLEDFFARRIFRDTNIVILFDDQNRIVQINSLGQKGTMLEYNKTSNKSNELSNGTDPLDHEIQPGIARRNVVFHKNHTDPMDREVQPGIKRQDVVFNEDRTDPMDHELQPGITRRQIPIIQSTTPEGEQEIQPGISRNNAIFQSNNTDPMDMEVQPGVPRRDTLGLN